MVNKFPNLLLVSYSCFHHRKLVTIQQHEIWTPVRLLVFSVCESITEHMGKPALTTWKTAYFHNHIPNIFTHISLCASKSNLCFAYLKDELMFIFESHQIPKHIRNLQVFPNPPPSGSLFLHTHKKKPLEQLNVQCRTKNQSTAATDETMNYF